MFYPFVIQTVLSFYEGNYLFMAINKEWKNLMLINRGSQYKNAVYIHSSALHSYWIRFNFLDDDIFDYLQT